MRAIGLDVHRDFCEVAIVEDGVVRSAGRVATTPETLGLFARTLGREDRVALKVTGNAWPAGHGAPDPQFEITGGWKSVRTVVDVGGGTGQAAERFARFFGHTTFTVIRSIIVVIWIGLNAVSVLTAQELGGRQQHHVWSRHGGRLTRARDGSVRWVDEGLPIAYQVLDEGVPVYASDGEQVGTVDHVVSAPSEHIFHGIVMSAGGGRRFVAADQVASLHEHGVDLRIDAAAAAALPEPHGGAAAWRDRDPGVKPSRWTHILDLMSGADPRRRDWTEED